MIDIASGVRQFKLMPYERLPTPEEPLYDWINVWVEFSLPVLNTKFSTSFTIVELKRLKEQLQTLYDSLITQQKNPDVIFDSREGQVKLIFNKTEFGEVVAINLTLRPEDNADSVEIKDFFGIDESYFPALLSGLDEMINWQN